MILMKRLAFDSLADTDLIWACIEPAIDKIRGQDYATKSEVYLELNPSQQALLMFQVLYGHTTHGAAEFYDHLAYLLPHKGVWSALKGGIEFFSDNTLLHLLVEMENVYDRLQKGSTLDAPGLEDAIKILDKSLGEQIPKTVQAVGNYIRENPSDFVIIED